MFAPRQEDIDRAKSIGVEDFIEEQLFPEDLDEPEIDNILEGFETLSMEPYEIFELENPQQVVGELVQSTLIRAILSRHQVYEMMVDFWSNHFNIHVRTQPEGYLKPTDDREVIRKHALGNFHDLLYASATSPAMLTYLDNAFSTQNIPNENYARELLELHTLGVDGGYTYNDIKETARALTGWTIVRPRDGVRQMGMRGAPGMFTFVPPMHDDGEKLILGQHFPAGQGVDDGNQLFELLAHHPWTATFISTKLVRRFVADNPPIGLVDKAAETFLQTDGNIREVLRTIFFSQEFRDSLGTKFKRPLEFFVSVMRVTGAEMQTGRRAGEFLQTMGQMPFFWPAPDGYPDYADAWVNTSGMMSRWNLALTVVFNQVRGNEIDWASFVDGVTDPEEFIPLLTESLLQDSLPDEPFQIVKSFAEALPSAIAVPGTAALLLASPYFQYR